MYRVVCQRATTVRQQCQRLFYPQRRYQSSGNSSLDVAREYKPNDKLHGFTVNKVVEVPELCLVSVWLNHDKTGAEYLHVARDDANNSFHVSFRTTPMDSTGVPHILEHTVLCGSERFPVSDPFFKMLNRSMATFMNAMTAYDWTMYPFSTQNPQDFKNLLNVYLDAVLQPKLRELDFCQEGWRLEHTDPNDPSSPVIFKGVVFNEMKGALADSQSLYSIAVLNNLLPSHTYGVVSGGEPMAILDLTWENLKQFHRTHYHPSNAKFYSYGNFPLENHLEIVNSQYLEKYEEINPNTEVPLEPRWSEAKEAVIYCQPDPMAADPSKQTTVSVNFLLSDITDINEALTLTILSSLLVDGEAAPFYQALLGANIGSDYSPMTGFQGYTREGTFSIGLQGIHDNDVAKVKEIIDQTIDNVIRDGFEEDRIEAILHKIELSLKHQTSNFGLHLGLALNSSWNHDADPSTFLRVNDQVDEFKKRLKFNPCYLQQKLEQYLKSNRHRLTLIMRPNEELSSQKQAEEEEKLQARLRELNDEQKSQIFQRGKELLEKQMKQEDISCLPTLKISDISPKIIAEPFEIIQSECAPPAESLPIYLCEQPTNGVTYFRGLASMASLSPELKPYVPLFCYIITKMGAGIYDYMELSKQIDLCSGGLSASVHLSESPDQPGQFQDGILLSSFALERNFERMLQLWTEIFNRPNLHGSPKNMERLTTLIRMSASELAASLSGSGHAYAMTHSASTLTAASKLREQFSGISQVSLMKRVAEAENQSKLIDHLEELAHKLLQKSNFRFALNTSGPAMRKSVRQFQDFLSSLPGEKIRGKRTKVEQTVFEPSSCKTHIELPFPVNYVSESFQGVHYTHEDYARLSILSRLLSAKFLHREIREKGGAYGSGAVCRSGLFSFFSYRDPNSLKTLDVFKQSVDWALDGKFTDADIDEAKLSMFQQIDKPVPPGSKGLTYFTQGVSDEMRQRNRDKLFAVSREEVMDVTARYLVPGHKLNSVTFLGPENEVTKGDNSWRVLTES
ncbi:presequence protease, mitochondrial-like [Liolophura sinensis]|uniref:presequence protease, mitochondrial-like n=1 Tax=Liolophura sinensis TaxID=3198878 RepID=UPI0031589878